MSDTTTTTETTETTEVEGQLFEMPSVGWVVHEVHRNTATAPLIWAWCRVGVDEPGYTEVHCTKPDGSTPVDTPDNLVLGPVITKVWC